MYDCDGVVRALVDTLVPQRGNTYAVSMFYPLNMSVAEIDKKYYPKDCSIDGTWKFDGANVFRDEMVINERNKRSNKAKRDALLIKVASAITIIQSCKLTGTFTPEDESKLLALQKHAVTIRNMDANSELPKWLEEINCL
jgi:hypothetical protein